MGLPLLRGMLIWSRLLKKSRNSMIFAAEDRNIHDCLYLDGTIILSPKLLVLMKLKLYQMEVHSASLSWNLNKEVEELCLTTKMHNIMENNMSNNTNNVCRTPNFSDHSYSF